MKHILFGGILFLAGVLVGCIGYGVSEGVRVAVHRAIDPVMEKVSPQEKVDTATQGATTQATGTKGTAPIKISPTALSDSQKALLKTVGVDPNSFVVTPKMIQCAEDTLGAVRVSEIVAGSKPSAVEMVKITPCL